MVNYKCDRCGFSTTRRNNFKNHLFRKNTCEAINEDIPIEILREKYGFFQKKTVNKKSTQSQHKINYESTKSQHKVNTKLLKIYNCDFCNKKFKSKQSKYRHQNKFCKVTLTKKVEWPLPKFFYKKIREYEKLKAKNQINYYDKFGVKVAYTYSAVCKKIDN